MSSPRVILIRETFLASAGKDLVSTGSLLGVVGVGIWLQSDALQWIAGVLWIIWFLARLANRAREDTYLTVAKARAALDEMERAEGSVK